MNNDLAFDWRSDASEENKRNVVQNRFGGTTPDYLWYALGDELKVDGAMLIAATAPLFWDKKPNFGDIEVHPSATASIGRCLRVRNVATWEPKLTIGRDCYLYMVGHADDHRHFSFEEQWERARFRPGTRVAVPESICKCSVSFKGEGWHRILPRADEIFTVVETKFCSPMQQAYLLSKLAAENPVLANAMMLKMVDAKGLVNIPDADLEIAVLRDSEGNRQELCVTMLKEVTD